MLLCFCVPPRLRFSALLRLSSSAPLLIWSSGSGTGPGPSPGPGPRSGPGPGPVPGPGPLSGPGPGPGPGAGAEAQRSRTAGELLPCAPAQQGSKVSEERRS